MYSRLGIWKTKSGIKIPQSCTYSSIYGHLGHFCGVGKFSSTMEHWGLRNSCLQRIKMETWSLAVEQPPVGAEVQILSWKLPLTTLETKGHSSMLHVWRKQIPTYTFGLLLGYMLRSMVLDGKLQFLFFLHNLSFYIRFCFVPGWWTFASDPRFWWNHWSTQVTFPCDSQGSRIRDPNSWIADTLTYLPSGN